MNTASTTSTELADAGSSTDGAPPTSRVATPEVVRQLVEQLRKQLTEPQSSHPEPLVVGARALPRWTHAPVLESTTGPIEVAACATPLAARRALLDHANSSSGAESTLVVLTDLADGELGADVLARFVRPYLFPLDPWEAVCHRFEVRRLDPGFAEAEHAWMADALLDVDPALIPRGAAMLSVDAALRALTRSILGATDISIERILAATADAGFAARIQGSDQRVLGRLCSTLGTRLGPAAELVTGAIIKGHGEMALPGGLAARTVAGRISGSFAQAKIEDMTGVETPTDRALEAWADSAELAHTELAATGDPAVFDLARIGSNLVDAWQAPSPEASDILAVGFEARLELLAGQLESTLDAGAEADTDALREAVDKVVAHQAAENDNGRSRAQRAQLAARLATWLSDPASNGEGLGSAPEDTASLNLTDAVHGYLADGAWVDRARRRVGEGDETPRAFAEVLRRIGRQAHETRAGGNRRFAGSLARWSTDGTAAELHGSAVVAVEEILGEVVVPLARKQPALLLVLDGCGVGPYLELADQFRRYGMQEIGHKGTRRCALAVLPTVTEVSRTSLLSGALARGNASDEKRNLPAHTAVAKLDGSAATLFHHRPDLIGGTAQGLPAPVLAALSSDGPRLVAVVVNTIDDELSRGTFNQEYRIEETGPLAALLRAAVNGGRAVVVTADHGHVLGLGLDGKGEVDRSGDGGERWRIADREPSDDEVLVRGPRVLLGDDRGVLMPWHDDLRYSAKHGGYHGGATPDECVVPLSVFLPTGMNAPAGWEPVATATPSWWDLHLDRPSEPATEKTTAPKRRKRTGPTKGQSSLFTDDATAQTGAEVGGRSSSDSTTATTQDAGGPTAPWMKPLLASELYKTQLSGVGRAKPPEDRVRSTLGVLHARGGVASFAVIAQATGMPLTRVPGFLARLQQVLNVDGFGVLTVDAAAQEARLDEVLLRTQFLGGTAP